MATLTIRDLDDDVRDRLRVRAAAHGRSMEAEVRAILAKAVGSPVTRSLADLLTDLAAAGRGGGFEVPDRVRHERATDPFGDRAHEHRG